MLPPGLTCSQCVLQWRYTAANNWGMCANGTGAVGCGPQEEFRACSDISIQDTAGTADETPYEEPTTKKTQKETTKKEKEETTPSIIDNEIPDEPFDQLQKESTQAKASQYAIFLASVVLLSLLVILMLFALLYFYYYHAGEVIQKWWAKGGSGLRDATCWTTIKAGIRSCSKRDKGKPDQKTCIDETQKEPVPPPRTKKHSIGFKGVPENLV